LTYEGVFNTDLVFSPELPTVKMLPNYGAAYFRSSSEMSARSF